MPPPSGGGLVDQAELRSEPANDPRGHERDEERGAKTDGNEENHAAVYLKDVKQSPVKDTPQSTSRSAEYRRRFVPGTW